MLARVVALQDTRVQIDVEDFRQEYAQRKISASVVVIALLFVPRRRGGLLHREVYDHDYYRQNE